MASLQGLSFPLCPSPSTLGIFLIVVMFDIALLQQSQLQTILKETSLEQNLMQINL